MLLRITPCSHCYFRYISTVLNRKPTHVLVYSLLTFFFYKYRISFKSDSYLSIQQSAYSSGRDAAEDRKVLLHLWGGQRCPGGSSCATDRFLPRLQLESLSSRTERGKAFSVPPSPSGGETDRLFVQNNSRMQHNLEDIMKCLRNGLRQITTVSRAKYSSGCTYFQSTACLNVRKCNSAL